MRKVYSHFPKRIFIFGVILFITVTSLLILSNYYSIRKEIITETQKHAITIANHLGYELFDVYGMKIEELKGEASDDFNNHFLKKAKPLGVESIKIYSTEGYIIFCNDPSLVGMRVPSNENFKMALQDKVTSNIASAEYYKKMYNVDMNKDLIETYIPVHNTNTGELEGVFEIYQDFTPLKMEIKAAMTRAATVVISLMLCFSIILFILVRRSNIIIAAEKERLVEELEDTVERRTCELRESERKYRTFLDNVTDSVAVIDKEGGFELINNKLAELTGYSYDEIYDKGFLDILDKSAENVRKATKLFEKALKGGSVTAEILIKRKDGTTVPLEVAAQKVFFDGNDMVMAAGRDITERKKIEEIKNDFYSMLTHDFRVPLTPIIGFSDMLLEDRWGELNHKSQEMVASIARNASRLNELIDDFLFTSKIDSKKLILVKTDVTLHTFIEDVLKNYLPLIDSKRVGIIRKFADKKLLVRADFSQMERVLSNLISNALKYNKPGGLVKIVTSTVRADNGKAFAKISIFNSYGVITEKDIPLVFEKYRRAERSKKISGTGLGLYIVKSIVNLHGGEIYVESKEGYGTTFTFTISLKEDDQA